MTPLKVLFSLVVLLLPGGSLVLLGMAVARALRITRERGLAPAAVPARRRLEVVPRR